MPFGEFCVFIIISILNVFNLSSKLLCLGFWTRVEKNTVKQSKELVKEKS